MITSPGREQRRELLDELIDRRAGLDHEHHLAGRGEAADQFFQAVAAAKHLPLARPLIKSSTLRTVRLKTHGVAAAFDVQRQVLAHHREANQTKITFIWHSKLQRDHLYFFIRHFDFQGGCSGR